MIHKTDFVAAFYRLSASNFILSSLSLFLYVFKQIELVVRNKFNWFWLFLW